MAPALAFGLADAPPSAAISTALLSWSQLSPSASPPARANTSLAFDASTSQLVLFGGTKSGGAEVDDTWTWSGASWSQADDSGDPGCLVTCTQSPPARTQGTMAYDPATGQLVVFGGLTNGSSSNVLDDTWTWSGTTWGQVDDTSDAGCTTSCTQSPPARYGATMDFDPQTGQLLLFGGTSSSSGTLNDTWAWNGTSWSQVDDSGDPGCSSTCTQSPPARSSATLTDDPALGEAVLAGGLSSGSSSLDDTWAWTGTSWSQIDDTGDAGCSTSCTQSPPARWAAAAAFDERSGQLVLLAGTGAGGNALDDTWALGSSGWSQIDDSGDAGCTSSCTSSPAARSGAALAYDPASAQLLAFGGLAGGGSDDADTWSLVPPAPTSPGWAQVNTAAAPSQRGVAMEAYDPATAQLVLFGGSGAAVYNDTWTWSGTSWTQVDDTSDPGCSSTCTSSPPSATRGRWPTTRRRASSSSSAGRSRGPTATTPGTGTARAGTSSTTAARRGASAPAPRARRPARGR